MKKRIISIILSIVMLVSLLPITALAADTYTVYVAGQAMTASTDGTVSYYVNGEGGAAGTATAEEPQSGWNAKLSYDTAEQTLVLEADGLIAPSTTVNGWTDGYGSCYGAIYSPDAPLKIVLKNNPSTIGSSGSNSGSGYGIYSSKVLTIDIEVSGSTVTAPGKNTSNSGSWGIRGVGNIVINSGDPNYTLTTSASGGSCGYTYGIFSNGSITFNGGTITANGGSGSSGNDNGITGKGITVNSGATVYGNGGSNGKSSYGFELSGFGTMEVKDGAAVYATGGTGSGGSTGINIGAGTLVINGGIFEAKGQSATNGSYGVSGDARGSFTINGGQVTLSASGGQNFNRACVSDVSRTLPAAYGWTTTAGGELILSSTTPYIYDAGHTYLYVEVLHAHPAHAHDMSVSCGGSGVTFEAWDGMGTPSGNVYLTDDVTLTETLTISSGTVNLCLNGHSITNNSAAIEVKSGATLNICDCSTEESGTVCATASGSQCIYNYGTVNVYGGTVSGNTYGICNNYGGNVAVSGGTVSGGTGIKNYGTLTVSGGTVTGTDTYGGYGISTQGTFKLSGAPAITGGSNSADVIIDDYQKVITIDGTLTYTSPIVVKMNSAGTFTAGWNTYMSGVQEAELNKYFTPADNGYIVVKSSSTGELRLSRIYNVSYNSNGATSGTAPVDDNSPYASGKTVTVLGNTGDLAKYGYEFAGWNTKADGTGTAYSPDGTFFITNNTTLYAVWNLHVHDCTYTVNTENAAQIIESCTCGHSETATLQLDANATLKYTGSAITPITVTYSDGWVGDKNAEISYTNNTNVGTASGSVTIGGLTVTKSFTITKKSAEAPAAPTAQNSITYGAKLSEVGLTDGWTWVNTETVPTVQNDGFKAYYKPNDTSNYDWTQVEGWNATENRLECTVSVTVNAKSLTNPTLTLDFSSFTYDGSAKTPSVTVKDGTTELTKNTDYTVNYSDNTNAGTGKVTVIFTGNYSGSAEKSFTISKATPVLGMVSVSGVVKDTTAPADVELTQTGTVAGKFEITDDAMLANKSTYNWTFTPTDTVNYTTITGTVEIEVADTQAPSATITVDTKEWKEKLNNITFGIFFDNTQTVTITYADNDNGSGIKTVQYLLSDAAITDFTNVSWNTYEGAFSINPDSKVVIYAKVTDDDGNSIIVNSNGIVLDKTAPVLSSITDGETYYGNKTFAVNDALAGVNAVTVDGTAVPLNNGEHTIVADNDQHTIVVTDNAGNATTYTVTVYKIYTVTYKADGQVVSSQSVNHGADATAPAIPTKDGYTQTAPYWDKDGKNITTDTEINAVYTINKYTVTYKADGVVVDTQTVEHGKNAAAPAIPTKVGYTQTAPTWDKDGKNITTDTEINAVYTINEYTVTYKADGVVVDTQTVEHGKNATAPAIPTKVGYTQTAPEWDGDGTNITADTVINAVYTINTYTVTYVIDGEVVDTQTVEHGTKIAEPTAPTKDKANFAGWFSDSDCTKAWSFGTDTVTADLTLYAKWSDVPVYHVSGKVEQETDVENVTTPVANATVKLMLGTTLIATETTDENGLFYFGGQKAGDYNVVVTSGDKVVTVLVTLHDHGEDGLTVELPQTVTNSIVKPEPAADGKDSVAAGTLVGRLEVVAAAVRDENQNAQKVEVKLTVADQPPVTGTPTAGTEAAKQQAQQKAIQQKAGGKQLVFFDLSVVKTINGGEPEAITDTGAKLLEIRIPFDSGNKWGITIYRYHDNKAEALAAVREGSTTEGFWVGDDGYIHIYTKKFSTYAVGYTVPSYGYFVPVTPDTVTSADTFDAGIVVYVTMSMLAATGSAVVIGKKRKEEN